MFTNHASFLIPTPGNHTTRCPRVACILHRNYTRFGETSQLPHLKTKSLHPGSGCRVRISGQPMAGVLYPGLRIAGMIFRTNGFVDGIIVLLSIISFLTCMELLSLLLYVHTVVWLEFFYKDGVEVRIWLTSWKCCVIQLKISYLPTYIYLFWLCIGYNCMYNIQ